MMTWSYHLLSNNDGMKLSSSQQQWWRQAFIFSATMMTWSFYLLSNKDGIQQKPLLPCYSWDWFSWCFSSLSGKKSQIPTALTIPMPSHDVILLFNLHKYSRNLLFFLYKSFLQNQQWALPWWVSVSYPDPVNQFGAYRRIRYSNLVHTDGSGTAIWWIQPDPDPTIHIHFQCKCITAAVSTEAWELEGGGGGQGQTY